MEKVSNGVTQVGFGAERWSHFESNRAAQVERTVPLESTLKVAKPVNFTNSVRSGETEPIKSSHPSYKMRYSVISDKNKKLKKSFMSSDAVAVAKPQLLFGFQNSSNE
ncbi:unnamed protein product [Rhizophagus irregularis]|nr:unnamed protein product [Rhizophagus irregularis]CAG8615806.1 7743_t:CDS:2 [Rhizophagus irregularis]